MARQDNKRSSRRPKPLSPRAGVKVSRNRYSCGGRIKK